VNFKLDLVELEHAARAEDRPGVLLHVLSLQLKDHGAPDAPFEQQAREMLSAFTAMQQAGEETWPSASELLDVWRDAMTDEDAKPEPVGETMSQWNERLDGAASAAGVALFRSRLSPVIGALQAKVAGLEVELAAAKRQAHIAEGIARDWEGV
jgi:hypothetical protein